MMASACVHVTPRTFLGTVKAQHQQHNPRNMAVWSHDKVSRSNHRDFGQHTFECF